MILLVHVASQRVVASKGHSVSPLYTLDSDTGSTLSTTLFNASGNAQELDRQFSLLSLCSIGITTGNVWAVLGGSIHSTMVARRVSYTSSMAVSAFFWMIAACIAEMASAIPSSAGVYHWPTPTGGAKYGKALGFFAGWWSCLGYIFNTASISLILAQQVVSIIIVCAIVPSKTGKGHASNGFAWEGWQNQTGWTSDGFVFCAGMLNGAMALGTPDLDALFSNPLAIPARRVVSPSHKLATAPSDLLLHFMPTRFLSPLIATLTCGHINTTLGAIYVANSTALTGYLDFIASGLFTMPSPVFYTSAGLATAYKCVFIVIYCFPYAVPFDEQSVNYSSLVTGGLTIVVGC
ncbi:uncharacterized protein EI97DRAFT_453276 [Westerdykella ornata]|uniref:Amino acid transporter n=1 Tax=Westerdykella ornata TaxID=318751 RepID=A0A6A6J7A0_WESOR|nr:uncharacterized protein EI97DRAFT_453276 [Westerdykella ornata]KAF2272077.1 hypothetical protein EI97DRAFT_453276 [Westerdykella ornata]